MKIIDIQNLTLGFALPKKQNKILLNSVSLTANLGELVAVIGANGVGKSTLLRCIMRLHKQLSGKVLINEIENTKYARLDFAQTISFVSTENVTVNYLRGFDVIALGRFPHTNWQGKLSTEDKQLIDNAIETIGLQSFINKFVSELSDGERQKVMIARCLAQNTPIIILDEPTAFLDIANKYDIVHTLSTLTKQSSKTIVFSTHDLNSAINQADKIWLILPEKTLEGTPQELIEQRAFNQLFVDKNFEFLQNELILKRNI